MEMAPRPEPRLNSLSLNPVQVSLLLFLLLALVAKRLSFDSSPISLAKEIAKLLLLAFVSLCDILH